MRPELEPAAGIITAVVAGVIFWLMVWLAW